MRDADVFHDEFCEACANAEDFYVTAWNEQEAEYQRELAGDDTTDEQREFMSRLVVSEREHQRQVQEIVERGYFVRYPNG